MLIPKNAFMAAKKDKKKAAKRDNKKAAKRVTNIRVGERKKTHRKSTRAVGATQHRKKRRVGATGTKTSLKSIAFMAVGVATGAGITHIVLRPLEKRLVDKWPAVGKFIAAGEVFLGGAIALKSKHNFLKSLGVGILSGGVHGLMKQVDIYKHIPGIAGSDEYTEIHVPISGSFHDMVAGILEDGRREVRTETVAGTNRTETVAATNHTEWVAGEWDEAFEVPVKSY